MYKIKLKDKGSSICGTKEGNIFEFSTFKEKDSFLLINKLEDEIDWIDWDDGKGPQKLILDLCGSMAWHPISGGI